ncbi:MAG: hypothetical protein JXR94_16815 [Candidatus Hydrogenedentes bacterium]|nr:hypothetical protein [Candidatus Hydrogenedentota bacterium]
MSGAADSPSPALVEACAVQQRAAAVGFDWPDVTGVLAKVREETAEIEHALAASDPQHAKRELGDLLFSAVNLARFLDADATQELRRATARFQCRFARVEREIERSGRSMTACSLEELDAVWERVKGDLSAHEEGA